MVRTLLIALFSSTLLQADEALLSVRTLGLDGIEMPEWHIAVGEDKYAQLEWPDSQPAAAVMAQAGKELQLYTKAAGENGEPEYKAERKVTLPESATEILLLASAAGKEGEIKLTAVADNLTKAGFNDWLVINLSERMVNLRFGKDNDPIALEAGESGVYKIKGEPGKGAEALAEAKLKNGEMRTIFSTFWSASAKQRSLVLFQEKDGHPKVQRIIDFLPKAAASE